MIKELYIKNFQSHKESTLEFHSGVNVIVGSSDGGKSVIIRALNWVINNKPSGDSFRRTGCKETMIEVKVEEGNLVTRAKIKKDNIYAVNDGESLKAFGQDVPEDIKKIFNMNSINVQYQFDAPFLLSMSSGEVATVLNEVVRLDSIDKCMSEINSRVLTLGKDLKQDIIRNEELEEKVKGYDYLKEMEVELIQLEEKQTQYDSLIEKINDIRELVSKIEECKQELDNYKFIDKAERELSRIEKKIVPLQEAVLLRDDLFDFLGRYKELKKDSEGFDFVEQAIKELSELQTKNEKFIKVDGVAGDLEEWFERYDKLKEGFVVLDKTFIVLHKEFDESFPDICPLCDQKVKKK